MPSRPFNPWHHVAPGPDVPRRVNGIIEIPRGGSDKYELDKKTGLIRLDRVLYSAMHYPINYGFIPQTLGEDGDPLDILVITRANIFPRVLVTANVIGVMRMTDTGQPDDKILAVAERDASVEHIHHINDLPAHTTQELKSFFEDYKKLEGKAVAVEDFLGFDDAARILLAAIRRYADSPYALEGL